MLPGGVDGDFDGRALAEREREGVAADVLPILQDVLIVGEVFRVLRAAEDAREPAALLPAENLIRLDGGLALRIGRPAALVIEHQLDQLVGHQLEDAVHVVGFHAEPGAAVEHVDLQIAGALQVVDDLAQLAAACIPAAGSRCG